MHTPLYTEPLPIQREVDWGPLVVAPVAGEPQKPVAWANWKVGTDSYVPYRTREEAQACVHRSAIAATQEGPYEVAALYAAPQASEAVRILFPTHLRKMWSGGEVQAWLDNHQGITSPTASAKGSWEHYRNWRAEQAEADKDGVRNKGRQ